MQHSICCLVVLGESSQRLLLLILFSLFKLHSSLLTTDKDIWILDRKSQKTEIFLEISLQTLNEKCRILTHDYSLVPMEL